MDQATTQADTDARVAAGMNDLPTVDEIAGPIYGAIFRLSEIAEWAGDLAVIPERHRADIEAVLRLMDEVETLVGGSGIWYTLALMQPSGVGKE